MKVKLLAAGRLRLNTGEQTIHLGSEGETIKTRFHQWDLQLHDLNPLGYDVKLFGLSGLALLFGT
ncbi:hypothetical protein KZ483_18500 [Paenibacillus sp. sptzw28]|uniref:hypothetical protein n=1 Tax=Paenibacillus sp. sptzw28 TaxID=715179 RepID=UPI001C6F2021|nr:hypothetical protein [Paenibacillus sp. sptzw28]QYR19855.1 hypothetical protein KZ483_18500 [Paenibacillus sp. sptzw28]